MSAHATATPAEREVLEPVIFSKLVDYRRDVKRGKITADPTTEKLLATYTARLKRG